MSCVVQLHNNDGGNLPVYFCDIVFKFSGHLQKTIDIQSYHLSLHCCQTNPVLRHSSQVAKNEC